LIGFIFGLLGVVISLLLGGGILLVGLVLTMSIIGALLGVPLTILGLLLVLRAMVGR